jgi:hypothetical protein
MGLGKQKAPPAPDYAALAKEQGAANLQAGQQTAALNRPDQYDPNGSQTWALKPGADPKNPQAGDWVVTSKLNDTQQALKDQQDKLSSQYGNLAAGALNTVGNTMSTKFDTSGLPQASALTTQGLGAFGQAPGTANNSYVGGPAQHQNVGMEGARDFGNVGQSSESTRQRVTDAMYKRQTANLDPQTQQAQSDLRSRLANQGIVAGSEAYNREMDNQARQQADAYASARNDAITAGGNEESRINNMNLGNAQFQNQTRAQQMAERLGITGFNNNNADTEWQQSMAGTAFNNDVNNTRFGQGMAGAQFANATRGQQFGENSAMNTANNTLHNNAVQEALMQRELGMNEANALRTGNQVGGMNFQQYGGAGQIGAAPVYQAGQDQYNAGLASTNAANAGASGIFGGAMQLGKLGLNAYSSGALGGLSKLFGG